MAAAVYSSLTGEPLDPLTAMTGEISVRGLIRPVGGIPAKIDAAVEAGIKTILIPRFNWQEGFKRHLTTRIIPVNSIEEAFGELFLKNEPMVVLPSP
jgi:Lon-like ATP-dependent protease